MATATLFLATGHQKTSIDLKPEDANAQVGEAIYSSVADMKVVINVTLPGQSTQNVKFEPLNPKSAAAKDPVHAVTEAHDHPADNASAHSHHP
jgi:membrane-associated protease RseP (regulator of RpoE activity)